MRWMYLFWSQYLVIWYGNIPEETSFVVARLGSQFIQDTWYLQGFWTRIGEPYVKITLVTWILLWVVPFWVLLGQRPKKTPLILGAVLAFTLRPPKAPAGGAPSPGENTQNLDVPAPTATMTVTP